MKKLLTFCFIAYSSIAFTAASAAEKLNVLFIMADDLRPQLGCYGDPTVKSPNIDKLAQRGMLFNRHYVQQGLCSPSRISLLSGRYPATTRIFGIGAKLRSTMPDITTLPQTFKNNGYEALSLGKVYHYGNKESIDDPASWSMSPWHSSKPRTSPETEAAVLKYMEDQKAKGIKVPPDGPTSTRAVIPPFEAVDCADEDLLDGDTAAYAVSKLRAYSKNPSQSFFLAVGFSNPHIPWIAPKKYFDLYDPAKLPLATNEFLPKGSPAFAATSGDGLSTYKDVPKGKGDKMPEDYKRACLQGYLAAISYVDAQVGLLLAALDETGLSKNTVIVLWGDNGFYMGEHTWWAGKHNNYEGATQTPLIIALPSQKTAGKKTDALAQSVDIAPTLIELCNLPANPGFQGRSLNPVIMDPSAKVNNAAFSWYPKAKHLGLAMRTEQWRYVEWTKPDSPTIVELFNSVDDTQNDLNLANNPEYAEVVKTLSRQMQESFPENKRGAPNPKKPKAAKNEET